MTVENEFYTFDCGCKFRIVGPKVLPNSDFPALKFDSDIRNIDHDINFECPKTYKMLSDGLTVGCFQVETPLGRQWTKKQKPEELEHISALGSILRPGALRAVDEEGISMTMHYCRRKNNEEETPSYHPVIDNILKDSYGCLIYQEQSIKIAQEVAGFSLEEADSLRKSIGKKLAEEMAKSKKLFLEKAKTQQILTEEQAEEVFGWIEKSQRYQFNRCISGETKLLRSSPGKFPFHWTIEEAYKIRNDIEYAKNTGHLALYKKWKMLKSYGKGWSMCEDGRIRPNKILDIQPAGKREVFKLTLESGKFIEITDNHKFPTSNGEKQLKELKLGDTLYTKGEYEKVRYRNYGWSNATIEDIRNRTIKHDHKTVGFMEGENNPGYVNGKFTEWKKNIQLLPLECNHCGKIKKRMEVHHKDRNRQNNSLDNLERLCASCHKKADYKLGRTKRGERGYSSLTEKIISIELVGEKEVYDVTMEGPNHNFVVDNGIVTCNSHATGYGITTYITAFLKAHFPVQFYTSWLSFAGEKPDPLEEISRLVQDAKLFDIEVLPPDIRYLRKNFHTDGKTIFFGLTDIKGVGESQFKKLKSRVEEISIDLNKMTWMDFLLKITDHISSTVVERLISTGALRCFGMHRQRMLFEYGKWNELTKTEKGWILERVDNFASLYDALIAVSPTKKNGGGCHTEKRSNIVMSLAKLLDRPPFSLDDSIDWISWTEESFLGVAITCTNLDNYNAAFANSTCRDVVKGNESYCVLGVEIKRVSEIKTKKGKNPGKMMGFLTVADDSGELDSVIVFPNVWEQVSDLLTVGNMVFLRGKLNEQKSFQVEKVYQMEQN